MHLLHLDTKGLFFLYFNGSFMIIKKGCKAKEYQLAERENSLSNWLSTAQQDLNGQPKALAKRTSSI